MRLDPLEVAYLPLAAAMVGRKGEVLASTPEWGGATPGSLIFGTGYGQLIVATEGASKELDEVTNLLLNALRDASTATEEPTSQRLAVLAASLSLVAGHPVHTETGDSDDVLLLAQAATTARAPGLIVDLRRVDPPIDVRAPSVIAFTLMQFAVNAHKHEEVEWVRFRAANGPTFYVEWPSEEQDTAQITTHRNQAKSRRWGWHYIQMAADALGGTALPPGPTDPGMKGCSISMGAATLTLPLAIIRGGKVERCTRTWDQNQDLPIKGEEVHGQLAQLVLEAQANPGQIAFAGLYQARSVDDITYMALSPQAGTSRAVSILRGMAHERTLWSCPEPHRTKLDALVTLLGIALGAPWPTVVAEIWSEFDHACRVLHVPLPPPIDPLTYPHPRVVAYLLQALEATLEQVDDVIYLVVPKHRQSDHLALALHMERTGKIRVN